jgi:hypothetical protein
MTDTEKLAIAIKTLQGISKMARISWELDYDGNFVYIEDFANETLEQIKGEQCVKN